MIKTIHPFPARMAPELALQKLSRLSLGSRVLDPMSGSGTVIRQASDLGHEAIGFDLDPLAVLMSRVWTTPIQEALLRETSSEVIFLAMQPTDEEIMLHWIDEDVETDAFIRYWFGEKQRLALRRLSYVLCGPLALKYDPAAIDALKIALSRIIITKDQCASLARDTSHSRPHKVCDASEFDVFVAFDRSVKAVAARLFTTPPSGNVFVGLGDARHLSEIATGSIDAVLTSPPYLNAIDYLRGHRLSLVWLGYRFSELRTIRSASIGAERGPLTGYDPAPLAAIKAAMGDIDELPPRFNRMIDRYVADVFGMLREVSRVLKTGAEASFVVGNSCLRSVFIQNSEAVAKAAEMVGLTEVSRVERSLPSSSRYLPMTLGSGLDKRMRTETILSFVN